MKVTAFTDIFADIYLDLDSVQLKMETIASPLQTIYSSHKSSDEQRAWQRKLS